MRYFFHIRHSDRYVEDIEGIEMPDLEAIKYEARSGARELIADTIRNDNPLDPNSTFEIHDENGALVHTLAFSTVLLASLAPAPSVLIGQAQPSSRRLA